MTYRVWLCEPGFIPEFVSGPFEREQAAYQFIEMDKELWGSWDDPDSTSFLDVIEDES